jgi:hypothetical protein
MRSTCCFAFSTIAAALILVNGSEAAPPVGSGKSTPVLKSTTPPLKKIEPATKFTPVSDPKPKLVLPPGGLGKIDPVVTTPIVTTPKLTPKLPIAEPKIDLGKVPGLKLPADFKAPDFKKLTPPIDLTKVKADKVLGMKPPADFKLKTLDLAKIHIPKDALSVAKLSAGLDLKGGKFIVNPAFCTTGDYHVKFGTKSAFGYCYPGKHHSHWHHCIWDPCFGCYYFYDPCVCCYYYWCEPACCYYPCWWFVDHCSSYYPWWVCGGFEPWGYGCGGPVVIRWGW